MSGHVNLAGFRLRMSRRVVSAATMLGAVMIAAFLVVVAATNSALAATALFVGGLGSPVVGDVLMGAALGGKYTGIDPVSGTPWVRQSVSWPAQAAPLGFTSLGDSVSQGTNNLISAIAAAQKSGNGPVTVVGMSAGTLVLDETMRYYKEHPEEAPDPKTVNFVVIGDGSRQSSFVPGFPVSGYVYKTPVTGPYNVTEVTYEYDGFADFPNQPLNLLAVANAVAGMVVLHSATFFADTSKMTPTSVVTDPVTGATTTKYLIKPAQLPLVTLFPGLAPIQDQLKQIIDSAYTRNDPVVATQSTVTDSSKNAADSSKLAATDNLEQSKTTPTDTDEALPGTPPADTLKTTPSRPDNFVDALTKLRTQADQRFAEFQKSLEQSFRPASTPASSSTPATTPATTPVKDPLPAKPVTAKPVRDAIRSTIADVKKAVDNFKSALKNASGQTPPKKESASQAKTEGKSESDGKASDGKSSDGKASSDAKGDSTSNKSADKPSGKPNRHGGANRHAASNS